MGLEIDTLPHKSIINSFIKNRPRKNLWFTKRIPTKSHGLLLEHSVYNRNAYFYDMPIFMEQYP